MLDLILIVSKVIYFNKKTLFHEHTDILLTEVWLGLSHWHYAFISMLFIRCHWKSYKSYFNFITWSDTLPLLILVKHVPLWLEQVRLAFLKQPHHPLLLLEHCFLLEDLPPRLQIPKIALLHFINRIIIIIWYVDSHALFAKTISNNILFILLKYLNTRKSPEGQWLSCHCLQSTK